MDVNPRIALANDFLEYTSSNIFLTGRAGTGKTTFLRHLREHSPKRMIVVAPTGVAAINAGGVTMHSFFQLPFGVWLPGIKRETVEAKRFSKEKIAIIKSLDLLVIDEISMVRADLLDSVDEVLRRYRDRRKPFGGVQLLMIGDLQQLAPVVKQEEWLLLKDHYNSPYFFDSVALRATSYVSIELRHIYRQSDPAFIELLSRVRENRMDEDVIRALNERYRPDFNPPQEEGYIILTSHNNTARSINSERLSELSAPSYYYEASVEGDFPEYLYPADTSLQLKEGAQVMFSKNDVHPDRRYVNGTIGRVTRLGDSYIEVLPAGASEAVEVEPADWENLKYTIDPQTKQIQEHITGLFTQYPLKTAWAITIHKSQGLTFDKTIIDAADSFSHGQVYVALSRCRTLEGIVLRSPLGRSSVINDPMVGHFTSYVENNHPTEQDLEAHRKLCYEQLLFDLFDFTPLRESHSALVRFAEQNMWRSFPRRVERMIEAEKELNETVFEVGLRFRTQISRMITDNYASDIQLSERVAKATLYFSQKCSAIAAALGEIAGMESDNKELRKKFAELLRQFSLALRIKLDTLAATEQGFDIKRYIEARSAAIASFELSGKERIKTPKAEKHPKATAEGAENEDVMVPELFDLLRSWRNEQAKAQSVPSYVVAPTKALIGLTNMMPSTETELLKIKGIGKIFAGKYGASVLSLIADFRAGRTGEHPQ